MNPLMLLPLLKSTWLQSKWIIILSVLAFSHYTAYTAGQKNILREEAKDQSNAVLVERERGARAVQRAASDVERIKELEKTNEQLLSQLEAIPDRAKCPIPPDELRILREAAESTR